MSNGRWRQQQVDQALAALLRLNDVEEHFRHRLAIIERKLVSQAQALADLQAAVAAEDAVIASAITLITGIAAQIEAAVAAAGSDDSAALTALATDVRAKADALAAAVAANTPAAPAPAPAPVDSPAPTPADPPVDSPAPAPADDGSQPAA